ncbi:hypothetical protein VD0004_g522 [Verticillium dahliae]|nr:hypothetical protein VD0004_g522 [Verticillium dahliae]PNH76860.1 hypothetical protein VD0001_g738 [Verticillium dahliae]
MSSPVNQKHDEYDEKHSNHTAETLHDPTNLQSHTDSQKPSHERPLMPLHVDSHNHLAPPTEGPFSPNGGGTREQASRLTDDLELLRVERLISNQENELNRSRSRSRQHQPEPEDLFAGKPVEDEKVERPPPEKKAGIFGYWLLRWLKKLPRCFRYFFYLLPGATLLLIPILIGYFSPGDRPVGGDGGVELMWFGIWLMIVWCTIWGARMITSLMPPTFAGIATLMGSNNGKKWKDIGRVLELHTALFIWMLSVLVSFKPINNSHRVPRTGDGDGSVEWINTVYKVIIAIFVLSALNFIEKIIIQWIATSFHQRTYAKRIEDNRSDIHHLIHLYDYAKEKIAHDDAIWETTGEAREGSGSRTPMAQLHNNVRQVFNKAGGLANRVGNDFIGRKTDLNHSKKIVFELLRTSSSAHSLARLIYRSLLNPNNETIYEDDMRIAFKTEEEAEHAFGIFDKDFNGDISMEEMECVCNEIHLERKAIAASLKDLDSVIQKLDKVFFFIIFVISIIVFITILSGSAAAGLASAGSAVLGLAWMLQATAQEFLQSIIFVFVKHPFDVGDRITVYGNTGTTLQGDDYYVTEISLLYTEFKKMEGHIVQAPNSVLNTLFILNQRRSAGLADPVELRLGFGTDPQLIENLKARMTDYCLANKRDYKPSVLTEVRTLNDVQSFTMNFIFFHKSNFQNELLRLQRHNKFVAQLMVEIRDLGLQGPWQVQPGGSREFPLHWAGAAPPPSYENSATKPSGTSGPGAVSGSAAAPPLQHSTSVTSGASTASRQTYTPAVRSVPLIEESFVDFQDVFESRKAEHTHKISRLQSIRENSSSNFRDGRSSQDRDSSPARTSGAARPSQDSTSRRHIFTGRARSRSTASKPPNDMV